MRSFSRGGLYLNFAGFGEEKEAMLRDAYGANYDRLVAIKTRYDPGNLFRMNLNIPRPAPPERSNEASTVGGRYGSGSESADSAWPCDSGPGDSSAPRLSSRTGRDRGYRE
jgi:hypothetical protein